MKPLLLACVASILLTCEGVPPPWGYGGEYCPYPKTQATPTLVRSRGFPFYDFKRAIRRKSRELQEHLTQLMKNNKGVIKQEKRDERQYCAYQRQCNVVKSIVNYWKLPVEETGATCWLIQPVLWAACNRRQVPNFKCSRCPNQDVLGFACVQQYQKQAVWVYCIDGTITVRKVAIASGCSAMYYLCDPANVPDYDWSFCRRMSQYH